MDCIAPITIETPLKIKLRNPKDASPYMGVPCGSCPTCLSKRSQMWIFRLKQEQKVSSSSYFLTLTYDEQNVPLTEGDIPSLYYPDYQKFTKRLRKHDKSKIKYYAIGEYGSETKRPHYHSIIFNIRDINNIYKSWDGGHIRIDECNVKTMAYVAKYVQKQTKFTDRNDPRVREKALMSKGLGKSYLTPQMQSYLRKHKQPYLTHQGGDKIALPRYYKEKVFNQQEKNEVNQNALQHIQNQDYFKSFHHENEWKKDQYRIRDKTANYKRNKV